MTLSHGPWTVLAQKTVGGPWENAGTYHTPAHASAVSKACARKAWVTQITTPDTPLAPSLPTTPSLCWYIAEEYKVKGFPGKPKPPTMESGFIAFKVPIVVVEVRAAHWPVSSGNIKISRSEHTVTVTFPNGDKSSMTPSAARLFIMGKFGEEMGDTVANKVKV